MPTFDCALTNVTRYLSDGLRADVIHFIVVTGPENLRISASDFPIRTAGADILDSEIGSLANSTSGPASGKPRANSVEETDPGSHDQVGGREAGVGSEQDLSFRWYFLSNVPAKRYLYWSGLSAARYIPKSCLVFRHQAELTTYQFDWGNMARGSVVYLCHGDGKVVRLAPGDPIVAGLTFTSLGEPLCDVTGLDKPALVTMSPGCYQADLFIDRLMDMNGSGSEDGFDTSRDEAVPLLLETASVSKENISFYKKNSLAPHQGSNPNGRLVHRSLVIAMKNTNVSNKSCSQPTTHAMLNAGVHDSLESVTGTDGIPIAKPSSGDGITDCGGSNKGSDDQSVCIGGAGISVLTNSLAAFQHFNPAPFAPLREVMPLYPSVFSSSEQISIPNEGGGREVRVKIPDMGRSGDPTDWMELPQGTYDPRAPPFVVPASHKGGKKSNKSPKFPSNGKDPWPPRTLMKGFEPIHSGFSELEVFRARLGGVGNWGAFPPTQVAVEYLPKELKRLDWTGREGDKGRLPDPILGRQSSPPEEIRDLGDPDFKGGHW